ncbi:G protein-coupled receptor, rhodopsin-like family and GPCR, rhodopsin-like [Dirofilaria immitis]|nr:G protein-coupled receptor, rhodopsin-like family and GPCR, rhodopsin-like [Dirofilaria immitis]
MGSENLCSIFISDNADLDDTFTSVYFLNGTSDAIRVSLVNRITYGYIAPIIISFGVIGDIMTVATLTRSLFKRSSIIYTYLILLAITDLSTLLSVIPMILWLLDYRLCSYPSSLYYAHIGFPLVNAFMGTSVWIVVFLTMSQYMAVCHPFHHQTKMCLFLVIISYVMNFCIYAPWAVKKVVYEVPSEIASCQFVVCDRKIETWYKVYEWCRETISRLLPFVLVAYFNLRILITYRNNKRNDLNDLLLIHKKFQQKLNKFPKTENDMIDGTDKQLAMIDNNLSDGFVLKTISEDADNDRNITTTTSNDILNSDIPIIFIGHNLEEIRLLIDGHSSMV